LLHALQGLFSLAVRIQLGLAAGENLMPQNETSNQTVFDKAALAIIVPLHEAS
jgi:hypothetical protein